MPSAVRRLRSQVRQNGSVVEAMIPNVVPSGSVYRAAGADVSSTIGGDPPVVARQRREHLAA